MCLEILGVFFFVLDVVVVISVGLLLRVTGSLKSDLENTFLIMKPGPANYQAVSAVCSREGQASKGGEGAGWFAVAGPVVSSDPG